MALDYAVGRRQYSTRSDRIIQNVMKMLILLERDISAAGFLAFFSRVPVERTRTERFEWDVDSLQPTSDTTAGTASASATSVAVTNPKFFVENQTWMNKRTGEMIQIEAVDYGGSNITMRRGISALDSGGGTAAASMVSGDTLVRMATIVGEDNRRQSTLSIIPNQVFNFTQAIRRDLIMSRRQRKREFESGDEWSWQEMKQLLEFRRDLEAAFLVNERARYTDSAEGDKTATAGIRSVISTYTSSVGGTLYEYDFDSFLTNKGLRKGSANKIMFCSNAVLLAVSEMVKDRVVYNLNLGTQKREVGIQVMAYNGPTGGRTLLVESRFLSDNFNGEAYGCDMNQLRRMVFSNNGINDDLHAIPDTGDRDDVGSAMTLYGDMGLRYGDESAHFKLTSVSGGAKSRSIS